MNIQNIFINFMRQAGNGDIFHLKEIYGERRKEGGRENRQRKIRDYFN